MRASLLYFLPSCSSKRWLMRKCPSPADTLPILRSWETAPKHVDRGIYGQYALGVAVAYGALAFAEVDRQAAEAYAGTVARVLLETVDDFEGIHLGPFAVHPYNSRTVIHDERGESLVRGYDLRAPSRFQVSIGVPIRVPGTPG